MQRISAKQFERQYGSEAKMRFDAINAARVGAPEQSGFNPLRNTVDRVTDIPSDLTETFNNMKSSVTDALQNNRDVRGRVEAGATTPIAGTGQILGGGLRAGAGVVGSAIQGIGKMFTTQKQEDKIGNAVGDGAEAIADTTVVQEIKQQYDQLDPATQRNVDAFLGTAEGFGTMFGAGPVFKTLRESLSSAGSLAERTASTVTPPVIRTSRDVANSVLGGTKTALQRTGEAVRPATDIVTGVGAQVTDFAKRTARGAQDTAQINRQLASLPEPEANIRRIVADERVINAIGRAPATEHLIIAELVEQAKKKQEFPESTSVAQPKQIAGREFLKPVNHLIVERKRVGAELGDLRKQLSTRREINTNNAFRNFRTYLRDDLGVQFDAKDQIIPGTGRLAKSDVGEVQKLYQELRPKVFMSQTDIDTFLQRSFKDYDVRQMREQTFSDDVSRIAERARKEMRQLMPEEYNRLATEYATMSRPLEDVVKLLGYKGDLDQLSAKDLKAGEVALRVLGSAADRPQSVIDSVTNAATKYGYTSDVELDRIIYLTDQLEDLYDITPSRGFSGSTSRGIDQSGAGVLGDVVTMNPGGLFDKAMSSKASREEVQEAFEAYVKSLTETPAINAEQ
jgi:hypothetical protein